MRISHKEKLQLGYSNPPHSPSRDPNSDNIDFSDVFGGPPRRASMQEGQGRHYDEDGADTWRGDGDGDEEMVRGRRSWSSNPRGNPVFGDEMGTRRRYPSQDFFDDIFRGDKCQSSSPRMGGRDPSSSCPGSRVLSPVRALPPGAVPLGSPAQFSLPARLASTHSSSTSMSRLSGGDAFSAYRRSPLSHKSSAEGEELRKDVKVDGSGGGTLAPNGGNQFHFSIHKWASKGMPLVMSLGKRHSSRSKIQLERSLSLNGEAELPRDTLVGEIQPAGVNDDCLAFKVHVVSAATKESDQIVDKSVTDAPKSSPKIEVEDGNKPVEVISYFAAESQDPANSVNSTSKEVKDVSKPDLNANKFDLKQSSTKLHEKKGRSGNDSAIPEVRINKRVVKKNSETSSDVDKNEGGEEVGKSKLKEKSIFKRDSKRNNGNHHKNLSNDTAREKIKESIANNRDKEKVKGDKDGSKGKVMEFVKIFNQEPSPKPTADAAVGKSPSSTWRNSEEPRASSKSTPSSSKTDGKLQGYDVNYSRVDPSPKEDGNHMPSSGKQFEANNVQESCQSSSTETENLGSTTGSTSDRFKASRSSIDVGFESFVIEELPEVQDKTSENREDNEELRAYESKILTWSKGKEGNIRALLSTLQYVLWPNSGWKPVPLVDIIEANAVKRSYQRALLYLHPDKLQQKGAAVHQKFIAEKVFDILQEAWDHFNTLGSL